METDAGDQPPATYATLAGGGQKILPYLAMIYGWLKGIECDLSEHVYNEWMDKLNVEAGPVAQRYRVLLHPGEIAICTASPGYTERFFFRPAH